MGVGEPSLISRRPACSWLSGNSPTRDWAGREPEVPLDEGLRRTSAWVADNPRLFTGDRYQV